MFGRLIKISNFLDESGRQEDADFLDKIIKKLTASDSEHISDIFDEIEEPDEDELALVESLKSGFRSFMNSEEANDLVMKYST